MNHLQQGDSCPLPRNIGRIGIGLGWDSSPEGTADFDLDVSAFLLNAKGFLVSDKFLVYYRNMQSPNGEVAHSGDNRSGFGYGDDECIWIDLSKADESISDILFIVSIHEGQLKHQHFGLISGAYIRAFREDTGEQLLRYELGSDLHFFDTGEFARIVRTKSGWEFLASGKGEHGGLETLIKMHTSRR